MNHSGDQPRKTSNGNIEKATYSLKICNSIDHVSRSDARGQWKHFKRHVLINLNWKKSPICSTQTNDNRFRGQINRIIVFDVDYLFYFLPRSLFY